MYLRQWSEEKFDTIPQATGGSATAPDIKLPDDHESENVQVQRDSTRMGRKVEILPNQQIPISDHIIIDNSVRIRILMTDLLRRRGTTPTRTPASSIGINAPSLDPRPVAPQINTSRNDYASPTTRHTAVNVGRPPTRSFT